MFNDDGHEWGVGESENLLFFTVLSSISSIKWKTCITLLCVFFHCTHKNIQQVCFSLVAHWLACIWYVIAEKEKFYSDQEYDVGELNFNVYELHNKKMLSSDFQSVYMPESSHVCEPFIKMLNLGLKASTWLPFEI
jgi:hypothetical protein